MAGSPSEAREVDPSAVASGRLFRRGPVTAGLVATGLVLAGLAAWQIWQVACRPLSQEEALRGISYGMQVQLPAGTRVVGFRPVWLHMSARVEFPRSGLDSFMRGLPRGFQRIETADRRRWISGGTVDDSVDWWRPDSVRKCTIVEYWQEGNIGVVLISEDDPLWVTVYMSSY